MRLSITQVNKPWYDNVLFVENNKNNEAWLLDCGDLHGLALRDLMRVTRVFISHTHIDHFFGIDMFVRMNLREHKNLFIYGPPGISDKLGHKLQGYAWDFDDEFDLCVTAYELHPDKVKSTKYVCNSGFVPQFVEEFPHKKCLDLPLGCKLRFTEAQHRKHAPCLAYALEEPNTVRINDNALKAHGVKPGSWLRELREHSERDDLSGGIELDGTFYTWKDLNDMCIVGEQGLRYAYITDSIFNKISVKSFRTLGDEFEELWCEACYAHDDLPKARARQHFTVKQSARLAQELHAKKLYLLHLSKRLGTEEKLSEHLASAREVFPNTCDPKYYADRK